MSSVIPAGRYGFFAAFTMEPVSGFELLTVRLQGASERYRNVAVHGPMWR
jgi:hypothetical protein